MKNRLTRIVIAGSGVVTALLVAAVLFSAGCGPKGKTAAVPYDLRFIDAMILHHQKAIDMAKQAESQAQRPELKDFARKIVADQSGEVAQMTAWRDKWYAGRPQAPDVMSMPGMAESMTTMSMGQMQMGSYDLMFIDMMVPHHQGAIIMAEDALTKAEHPEIRTLARQIIDAQHREVEMMKGWKTAWAVGGH